jgi:hypothetical protein
VSHWAVASNAATRLTTSAFSTLAADPTLGRAEAMRRAMLSLLDDKSSIENAYRPLNRFRRGNAAIQFRNIRVYADVTYPQFI